jgi:hypothetical protein
MSDANDPKWDAVMEKRGVEAVRDLLARSPGAGAGAVVRGLGDTTEERPTRVHAENWVRQKVAEQQKRLEEQQAQQEKLTRRSIAWAAAGTVAAGISALMAFLAWRFPNSEPDRPAAPDRAAS